MLCCSISDIDLCFVFFKQKTAYEMRISDWSSDVCSSDLASMPGRLPRSFTGSASMQITHCMPYRNDQSIVSIVSPRTASACVHGMRSEERRVGKECVSTCSSRWSPYHSKKKQQKNNHIEHAIVR